VDHTADWWLGDLTHPWFLELERAIYDEWGTEPMRVREGGVRIFFPPILSSIANTFLPAQVYTMYTVPRKSLWLSRASPPDVPKLGAFVIRCSTPTIRLLTDAGRCSIGSSAPAE
jgi:hypothetical protein